MQFLKVDLKCGLDNAISSAINLGKSSIGIFNGDFKNIEQVQMAVGKGGIIDSVSDLIDLSTKKAKENGLISNSTYSVIKAGKNTIVKSIENNIENNFENQLKSIKKISDYSQKWNECYNLKDFEGMDKAYKNIKKYLNETIPIETSLKEARTIENLHTLIKSRGGDLTLTEEEIKLAENL